MQIAYSFDKITQNKIVRGAIIALSGSAALGLLNYFGTLHLDNPMATAFVAWLVPVATNSVKEWMAGEDQKG